MVPLRFFPGPVIFKHKPEREGGANLMELTYTQYGDYLLPDLKLPEQPRSGNTACCANTFLKEHRPATYTAFLLSGKLSEHLAEADGSAREARPAADRKAGGNSGALTKR
jgi:hypothetical protein